MQLAALNFRTLKGVQKTLKIRKFFFPKNVINVVLMYLMGFSDFALALEFPDQPLLTPLVPEPNVMLLIDNSASMAMFEVGNYDANIDYANCPESLQLPLQQVRTLDRFPTPSNQTVRIAIDSMGRVSFTYNGFQYEWGTAEGLGPQGFELRCFPDVVTDALRINPEGEGIRLNFNDENIPLYRTVYSLEGRATTQSGNFWNFFFSNFDQSGPAIFANRESKFGVGRRIDIAEQAAEVLVETISDVKLGLSVFQTQVNTRAEATGAVIVQGIQTLNTNNGGASHRQAILNSIDNIQTSGNTPIAESLLDIGRYYMTGFEDQNIIIHPNTALEQSLPATDLFSTLPEYSDGAIVSTAENPVIEEFCQQNFIVALTDGEPNELSVLNSHIVGGTEVGSNYRGYSDVINLFTGDFNVIDLGTPDNGVSYLRNRGVLDDVALALFDIDLRPDLSDPANNPIKNNVSTYFVAGFSPTLAANRELAEAAFNSVEGGGRIFPALDADELVVAFSEVFGEIFAASGTFSSVAFNSARLTSGTFLYQASYQVSNNFWVGDLQAFSADITAENINEIFNNNPVWSASDLLTRRVLNSGIDSRQILTMSDFSALEGSSGRDGIAFNSNSFQQGLFNEEQNADLRGVISNDNNPLDVINYIRGEESPEFRTRVSGQFGLLGDIVNSSPIQVGAPNLNYPDFSENALVPFGDSTLNGSYSNFVQSHENRAPVLYVGANDGMMHAFSGETGEELFAYIPSMVFDGTSEQEGLFYLTRKNYRHKFYVDGAMVASDVFINPNGDNFAREWRTILVGALRTGGKGLFALDVTNPESINENTAQQSVLWEFDGADGLSGDSDMGHIFGNPQIAMMNNGQFAVITGNGYNSESGLAKLFIIFIEAGADGRWQSGDWIELNTNNDGDNGLSAPTLVDLNGDQIVDRIYAGDLKGNLWAFDVSANNSSLWRSAFGREGNATPLYTAVNNGEQFQQITTAPLIAFNSETPVIGNEPNLLVLFGTGQLIESDDFADTTEQAFYAVWDRGQGDLDRDDLHERRLLTGASFRQLDTASPFGDPIAWFNEGTEADEFGWYINLPNNNERIVVEPTLLAGSVFFASVSPSLSACSGGGIGFLNAIGLDGLATRTPIFDFDNDGQVDNQDQGFVSQAIFGAPNGSTFIGSPTGVEPCGTNGYLQAYTTSDGNLEFRSICPETSGGLGRRAWTEIFRN